MHMTHHNTGAPIRRMGIPDQFIEHGNVDELLAEIGMTADHLVDNMSQLRQRMWSGKGTSMTNRTTKERVDVLLVERGLVRNKGTSKALDYGGHRLFCRNKTR